ncbi:exodeoxyribonuclease VII small subunit [Janibacter alittae]|uniref:Exodeoxyribonuclease 7 small subunit n=1 Tax=Janibacter alittae TaxID=3115209 RepID=A0ABZ2MJ60_9MICO
MDDEQQPTDVEDLGYEEARQELVELVARLEGGQAGLEESMRLWQRGEALAAHCEAWLDKAEASLASGEQSQDDADDD